MMVRSRQKGFTLIELLVVIAIIAILAAILFPIFSKAKAAAKLSSCQNNLKQLQVGMSLYMETYNDRFPWAGANTAFPHDYRKPPYGTGGSLTCFTALMPYIKNKDIGYCPEFPSRDKTANGWSYWYYCPHNGNDPKVGNQFVLNYNHGKAALCGYMMSDIKFPSKKPSIAETYSLHGRYNGAGSYYQYPISYCDGHIKVINIASDKDPKLTQELYIGRDGTFQ